MASRETISSRFGFIMLAAGCAIGLGNVWRFPYMCGAHGGALFVLFYLFFLVILGFPCMSMELAVGRASQLNLVGAFATLPEKKPSRWRYPAAVAFWGNVVLMMMYTTVTGWMLTYAVDFAGGKLHGLETAEATGAAFGELLASPGKMTVYMLITVALGSLVCGIGLQKGVERITKLLMCGLFFLLFALSIYGLTLPGAKEGMLFYMKPDWNALTGANFWKTMVGAMSQAFFTLSLGVGSIEIFGSYIQKENSLASDTALIIICDTIVALFSGVIIFASCFTYGTSVQSGPGLIFVSLTNIFNHLPGGQFFGTVFFLFMSIAAMTTVIAVFENLIALMIDNWHFSRKNAAIVNFIGLSLLSLPCVLGFNLLSGFQPFGADSCVLDFEDWLVSDMLLPLGALMITIFCTRKIGWGWNKFLAEANLGKGLPFPAWLKTYCSYVIPAVILVIFVLGIYNRFFAK